MIMKTSIDQKNQPLMKIGARTALWVGTALMTFSLAAQPETNSPSASAKPDSATNGTKTAAAEAPAPANADTNLVTMNFRGASLDQVLDHLSKTAGFIINV